MVFLRRVCKILWEWSTRYPLLLLESAILITILYGISGHKLGLTYLFWNESGWVQFTAGIAVGLLLSEIIFVGFLLDADEDWFPELFGIKAEKEGLATIWPMLRTMLAFFWIILIPAAFLVQVKKSLFFHPGLLVGFAIFAGLIRYASPRFAQKVKPLAHYVFKKLKKKEPEETELQLHSVALSFFVGFSILYAAMVLLARHLQGFPPAAAICTLLAVVTAIYGAIHFHLQKRRLIIFVAIVAIWILSANIQKFRHGIPELNYEKESILPVEKYPIVPRSESGLLNNQEVLNRWKEMHRRGGSKYPPLVLICAGGGGIRAALWSAVVLKTLEEEKELENFPYYIRIITGASGGMLGSSYYVATLNPPESAKQHSVPLDQIIQNLGKDSLSDVARTLVLRDIIPFLGFTRYDRGVSLQRAWARNTDHVSEANVLETPFRRLSEGEQAGWRPSLILTPMIVEDGRLLVISNLDLDDLTANRPSELSPEANFASRQAFEFYRMFSDSQLLLSTAIRLNASFPYVTPSAELPTKPVMRLVDAGYFDNYGVNLITEWLFSNLKGRESIHDQVSGILLIQIRHHLDKILPGQEIPWWQRGISGLTTPIEGALRARESILSFRNDEDLEHLSHVLNRQSAEPGANFFTTVAFELQEDVALSWILTETEKQEILEGMDHENNREALESVIDWWKQYGPSNTPPDQKDDSNESVLQKSLE